MVRAVVLRRGRGVASRDSYSFPRPKVVDAIARVLRESRRSGQARSAWSSTTSHARRGRQGPRPGRSRHHRRRPSLVHAYGEVKMTSPPGAHSPAINQQELAGPRDRVEHVERDHAIVHPGHERRIERIAAHRGCDGSPTPRESPAMRWQRRSCDRLTRRFVDDPDRRREGDAHGAATRHAGRHRPRDRPCARARPRCGPCCSQARRLARRAGGRRAWRRSHSIAAGTGGSARSPHCASM